MDRLADYKQAGKQANRQIERQACRQAVTLIHILLVKLNLVKTVQIDCQFGITFLLVFFFTFALLHSRTLSLLLQSLKRINSRWIEKAPLNDVKLHACCVCSEYTEL